MYLDCGCYIEKGTNKRVWCPTCLSPPSREISCTAIIILDYPVSDGYYWFNGITKNHYEIVQVVDFTKKGVEASVFFMGVAEAMKLTNLPKGDWIKIENFQK